LFKEREGEYVIRERTHKGEEEWISGVKWNVDGGGMGRRRGDELRGVGKGTRKGKEDRGRREGM
jgi:hypothetical protein